MRRTILAALAALALLPALSLASAPPDTLPESFPAVGWQKVDSAELYELRRVVYGSGNLDSLQAVWARTPPESLKADPFETHSWLAAPLQGDVSQSLPGVRFYRWVHGGWNSRADAVALYNGRFYELRSLNKLLVDIGFRFDTTEIPAIAKIAVLWTLMQRQAGLREELGCLPMIRSPAPDSAALATAIPAVTFRKVGPSKVQLDGLPARTIEVQCEVDGELVSFHLSLDYGRYPMRLHGFGRQLMFFADPPAPQK